jgi:integrase
MNRPRKSKGPYPPCFYSKHGAYYVVKANKWTRLGTDLGLALAEYARLMDGDRLGGMPALIAAALPGILRDKAKNTQAQYCYAAETLTRKLRQFEPGEVDQAVVYGIQESMDETPNMANRVLTVLRRVFTYAVKKKIVRSNPCVGVERLPEGKRTRLISDDEWHAIHAAASPRLRVIMELEHLTGQRIGDVLKIRRSQLTEEGIVFEQQKTGAKLTVRWTPALRATVERAKALPGTPTLTLLRNRMGKAPDYGSVYREWASACQAAGVEDARPNDTALLGHKSAKMTDRYLRDREASEVDGPDMPSIRQPLDVGQKR